MRSKILILLPFMYSFLSADIVYETKITGDLPEGLRKTIEEGSQLKNEEGRPPPTMNALIRRAENDIPNLVSILRSQAYYNALITYEIQENLEPVQVILSIDKDVVYPIGSFKIVSKGEKEPYFNLSTIDLSLLGVDVSKPAYSKTIIEAQEKLLDRLSFLGYPFATIVGQIILADQTTQTIDITLEVDSGPLVYFGKTHIRGIERVKRSFFEQKIVWERGELFDPTLIDQTLLELEKTNLFSSISITYPEDKEEAYDLPMFIDVLEARTRSIGVGLSYALVRGIGGSFEWENRNYRGRGDTLRIKTNLWMKDQEALLSYIIPDFYAKKQSLILGLDAQNEFIEPRYTSFLLSALIDKECNRKERVIGGISYKFLNDPKTSIETYFHILKFPFEYRFKDTDSLLDPSSGSTLTLKIIPSTQLIDHQFFYSINTLTATKYTPLTSALTLSFKGSIGSIAFSSRGLIPKSERFYMGSENTLRGYPYRKVSPLDENGEPTGGRSYILFTAEARARLTQCLGLVLFYDIGNVYKNPYLDFKIPLLQSVGTGFRYFTPVGPLRLDFAIPLNRRKGIDGPYQIYIGIGQAF